MPYSNRVMSYVSPPVSASTLCPVIRLNSPPTRKVAGSPDTAVSVGSASVFMTPACSIAFRYALMVADPIAPPILSCDGESGFPRPKKLSLIAPPGNTV